jgi:hypothetical protein
MVVRNRKKELSEAGTSDPAIQWLLASEEPAVRYLTHRDVLGESVEPNAAEILAGPKVSALLHGQLPDGGFGGHPYKKWTGAFWRLISLVELAAPPGEPRLLAAAETVLRLVTSPGRRRNLDVIDGLARRCASHEGNALAVCSRIGLTDDPRVARLAESLVEWQWPDGGWNCDRRATGYRSSFHESLAPAWGLHEYWLATGSAWAREAAARTAELFLEHRVFKTLRTGEPINEEWLAFHYPPYWHYDVLQALLILSRLDKLPDPRADDALGLVLEQRRPDGLWEPGGFWWRRPGSRMHAEVVDWGRRGPNEMITLNALRALRAVGRLL